MISNDTKFGYEKILGLRGDRTGQKKRSLEARADAFSRLKRVTKLIVIEIYDLCKGNQSNKNN